MASTLETKAAALEGLDFIETEEDVKAVEAATLKIQSTFRGKKIRSKVTGTSKQQQPQSDSSNKQESACRPTATPPDDDSKKTTPVSKEQNDEELSSKLAHMQVQDNNNNQMDGKQQQEQQKMANNPSSKGPALPEEDEAQRAATKIQAGFKGYKARKELEGKLPTASSTSASPSGGRQEGQTASP